MQLIVRLTIFLIGIKSLKINEAQETFLDVDLFSSAKQSFILFYVAYLLCMVIFIILYVTFSLHIIIIHIYLV